MDWIVSPHPPSNMLKSLSLLPPCLEEVFFFFFEEVISKDEVMRRAVIQQNWCPYKKGKLGYKDTHTGRALCEQEVEIGVMQLQDKEHQGLPANH